MGTLAEWVSWALGKEPGFTRYRSVYTVGPTRTPHRSLTLEICFVSLPASRVAVTSSSRWFNIEKARRVLGYEPKVGLEEGIKRSVAVGLCAKPR